MRSTIKDVAKLAGVSPSTVSRTLSKRIFVEEETRQKVMKAVEELNYRPSITAKGLRKGRTYVIGFLVPEIDNLYYPMIMKWIEHYAALKDYNVMLCSSNNSVEMEQSNMEALGQYGIDGLLCMTVSDEVGHFVRFQKEQDIPVVLVNRSLNEEEISGVTVDNEYGGYLAMSYLLERGHKRIAGVFGDFERKHFRERCQGCKRALEERGIQNYKRYFAYDVTTLDEAYDRAKELMSRKDPPTAFFASMDILAVGIYRCVNEMGLRIPEDISVVGFDDLFLSQFMLPPLTTYEGAVEEVARNSIERLAAKIEGRDGQWPDVLKGTLIERGSAGRLDSVPDPQ